MIDFLTASTRRTFLKRRRNATCDLQCSDRPWLHSKKICGMPRRNKYLNNLICILLSVTIMLVFKNSINVIYTLNSFIHSVQYFKKRKILRLTNGWLAVVKSHLIYLIHYIFMILWLSWINCMCEWRFRWFLENNFLLNPTKTEAILLGTDQTHQPLFLCWRCWLCIIVKFTDALKLLGVTLDSSLSFDRHITEVCRSCHFYSASA